MSNWAGSTRREELPPNWEQIRRRVLQRDGNRCVMLRHDGSRCWDKATDVDHIERGNDHRLENLRSLCAWHHQRRTGADGGKAKAENRKKIDNKFRRSEAHPGLL